jgi:hypothetical protein
MNKDLINRVTSLFDLENPQQVITMLMVLDELERLYKAEQGVCPCKKREAELEQMFAYFEEDERQC